MLGYVSGIYDILRSKDLYKLDEMIQKNKESGNKYFAIAIYDEELCEKLGLSVPLKSTTDRLNIMKYISGVDFTFPISSLDEKIIQSRARKAFEEYQNELSNNEKEIVKKEYNMAYVPGTFDLFHAGHLENLLEASRRANRVVVGVKSDELVEKHKGQPPIIKAEERMEILRHFKFTDNVYQYFTRDPHTALDWIETKLKETPDAIFVGSDLEEFFSQFADLNIICTYRDPNKMKDRSTSGYKKKLQLKNVSVNEQRYTGNVKKSGLNSVGISHEEEEGEQLE